MYLLRLKTRWMNWAARQYDACGILYVISFFTNSFGRVNGKWGLTSIIFISTKTSSTKVVQYASTQWLSLTSYFNLAPFDLCRLYNFKLYNEVLQQLCSICIAHDFHHNWRKEDVWLCIPNVVFEFVFFGKMYSGKRITHFKWHARG